MHPLIQSAFVLYQWLIAFPILLIITILTAILTIILSPLFPNKQFSYFPAKWWGRIFCYMSFVKIRLNGVDNIKQNQSYIFAANHQSMYDIFVIYGWLPVIFKWVMKAELRRVPFVGKACESAGHIFIDRKSAVSARTSIEKAESQLINGISVVVFPEGTRTYDGELSKFKKGAFRMAVDIKLPIIPITINGGFWCMSRNTYHVTPGTIELIFHEPIYPNVDNVNEVDNLLNKTFESIKSAL